MAQQVERGQVGPENKITVADGFRVIGARHHIGFYIQGENSGGKGDAVAQYVLELRQGHGLAARNAIKIRIFGPDAFNVMSPQPVHNIVFAATEKYRPVAPRGHDSALPVYFYVGGR